MHTRSFFIVFIASLLFCVNGYSAFPVNTRGNNNQQMQTTLQRNSSENRSNHAIKNIFNLKRLHQFFAQPDISSILKAAAIILNILGIFFFVYGLHRFLYGYWLAGALQTLGGLAIFIGFVMIFGFMGPIIITPLGLALLIYGGLMLLWHISDLIRMIANNLVPKGEKRPPSHRYHYRNHSYR